MSSQTSTTSCSYKSTTVSINACSPHPSDNIVITHTSPLPPAPQFTNLIETEKSLLLQDSSEREHVTPNNAAYTNNDPVVIVTNPEFTDDDEFECDSEINRITNYRSGRSGSPEPTGNHELAGLRVTVGTESFDQGVECLEGVEFIEFSVHDTTNVSSKSSKSSSKQVYSSAVQSSVEHVSKQEAGILESSVNSISCEQVNSVAMVNKDVNEDVKDKKGKVERKSSKAGKKKGNAEISKENISVTTLTNQCNGASDQKPALIPDDLAKKLGPAESRVFAKVCVANLRRSFGDLTALTSADYSLKQFSGSNSLEYNRINCVSREFKKSSFSKFDSLVAKNGEQQESVATCESTVAPTTKPEAKKMFCASCDKQVFQMELIRAEKMDWHKNCFRCICCRKVLSVDTYQSHESRLYCKPHFKELFQPKAVLDDGQEERSDSAASKSSDKRSKLQLIICESQPKELPPDVVRASDAPSTGLQDIQVDVRSKFELFEGLKEKDGGDKEPEVLVVKRSASVLAKLKKYENSLANGNTELEGVCDEDLHGVDPIELQSYEDAAEYEDNSFIKDEIKRKLKNPLQALNEIAHFKQMEQVRSKWEEGTFTRDQMNAESRKEELQKFRSRLCQGKSGQLKELYEKGVESGGDGLSDGRRAEIEELGFEKARGLRDMFERGEVMRGDDEEAGESKGSRGGVDLDVFEAGVAKESKRLFEELDKKLVIEEKEVKARAGRFVGRVKLPQNQVVGEPVSPGDIVRSSDKIDEPLKVNTAELSNKFKFFETYEDEIARKAKEEKREVFKRITPPREDGVVKTDKDYDLVDGDQTYRDPSVVRHGETEQDDTLQKSKTTSKMLGLFRQMEENLSKGEGKESRKRPLKQFTPPRDTIGGNGRVVDSDDEEECEDEEDEVEEDEVEEERGGEELRTEDEFLKEVGSLARARSLRAKFERWEQQENERNKQQGVPEELAESIESAKNLKAKFEAMRFMGDKENGGGRGVPIKVNRFV